MPKMYTQCRNINKSRRLLFCIHPLDVSVICIRTCHAGRHQSGEHEKEHSEEETAGIVVHLGRLVADVHVQHADEDADHQVRYQP